MPVTDAGWSIRFSWLGLKLPSRLLQAMSKFAMVKVGC